MEQQSDIGTGRKTIMTLTEKEQEIVRMMRAQQDGSLIIKYRDGGIERIEVEESLDVDRRIGDIIRDSDHQDVTMKVADGKVVSIVVRRKYVTPRILRLTRKP